MFMPAAVRPFVLSLALLSSAATFAATPVRLEQHFDFPGAPVAFLPGDLDRDGVTDLVVIVAGAQWREIGVSESQRIDELGALVEVYTVVPSIFERREAWAFRGRPEGGFESFGPPLALPLSVLAVLAGPAGEPVVAWTEDGASALRLVSPPTADAAPTRAGHSPAPTGDSTGPPDEPLPALELVAIAAEPAVLAGSGLFLAELDLTADLDGDGLDDLFLPGADALAILRGGPEGVTPFARLEVPGDAWSSSDVLVRRYPLPFVGDVDGDHRPDLAFQDVLEGWGLVRVVKNLGGGRFGSPVSLRLAPPRGSDGPEAVFFGDLDGDGRAEAVLQTETQATRNGLRAALEEAREPKSKIELFRVDGALKRADAPYQTLEVSGFLISAEAGLPVPSGILDLDGDRRLDLATLTTDFSTFKALASLTTKRLDLDMIPRVWCQGADGRLAPVKLDLSGRMRFDLEDLRPKRLAFFAGDFDGDGRADFVEMGRGREVRIHRGSPGCRYSTQADWTLQLPNEPLDVARIEIRDIDGDRRADLLVVQPGRAPEPGLSAPVGLDLVLSRKGGRP
jgi:hypothetical protein